MLANTIKQNENRKHNGILRKLTLSEVKKQKFFTKKRRGENFIICLRKLMRIIKVCREIKSHNIIK